MGRISRAAVYALLAAYVMLSINAWPLLVEANIPDFSTIQENLVRLSLTRRSMKEDPLPSGRRPSRAPMKQQFSPSIYAPRGR
ncbi:hypothetical protein QUC31_004208 [Theobroma cacao]|uniref:Uncharacterized protein n=1 Tax=Theobroma cacao TaxID=3641 RepID=A0A061DUF2_THECC|nr:Uncharacterized protein TCM_002505 [Theobroma cacao]